jgi:peptide/nickel transport system substrate-binding protein
MMRAAEGHPLAVRLRAPAAGILLWAVLTATGHTDGATHPQFPETPILSESVRAGELPPVTARLPDTPLVADLERPGLSLGRHGGTLRTLIGRPRDIRHMVTWGYARLVGYTPELELKPDILLGVEVEDDRVFTLRLRPGHKWSDGHPFTTEDFRYYWEDVASHPELSPGGPPVFMLTEGTLPEVEILSATEIRYRWPKRNPVFLTELAGPRPPFIYRPAHYLKRFHADYTDKEELEEAIKRERVRNWAQLHNRYDNMARYDNPDLPSLQPWILTTAPPASRFEFIRNPFYHRVDSQGRQLPYIDRVAMTVSEPRLIPAKVTAGEADLQARGLSFADIAVLKRGEKRQPYTVRLWPEGNGAHFALYPNLNTDDPAWRTLLRDARFRRALSLGIDRTLINNALFFGMGRPGNNAVLDASPLYAPDYVTANAVYDPAGANRLLDALGLERRSAHAVRNLPDGRPLEIVVETAGEIPAEVDALELIAETWREIGVRLFIKPSERSLMRNRAYAGKALMTMWSGWDNGIPTPGMAPGALAPVDQANLAWPKWGQYYQTGGRNGEAVDLPAARRLLVLYEQWRDAQTTEQRRQIWTRMLAIHAGEQFVIGIVSAVDQPVAVSRLLHNLPENGIWSWEPGAHFGIYRPDQFWFDDSAEAP